jgi:hypothetical protein
MHFPDTGRRPCHSTDRLLRNSESRTEHVCRDDCSVVRSGHVPPLAYLGRVLVKHAVRSRPLLLQSGHSARPSARLLWANQRHRSPARQSGPSLQIKLRAALDWPFLTPKLRISSAECAQTVKRASASAARGTMCGTPTSSRVGPAAHAACMSTPPHCFPKRPTAAQRNRSGCRPSRNPPHGRPRL